MQNNWQTCLNFVLNQEVGFENNPQDPGVWTGGEIGQGSQIGSNLGISAATLAGFYPTYSTDQLSVLMQNLTSDQAGQIYSTNYWQFIQGDSLPSGIDILLFDDSVNKGVNAAVKTIQGCVKVIQDGDLGPETLAAIQNYSISALFMILGAAQANLYIQGSEWSTFGLGWSRRWAARMNSGAGLLNG